MSHICNYDTRDYLYRLHEGAIPSDWDRIRVTKKDVKRYRGQRAADRRRVIKFLEYVGFVDIPSMKPCSAEVLERVIDLIGPLSENEHVLAAIGPLCETYVRIGKGMFDTNTTYHKSNDLRNLTLAELEGVFPGERDPMRQLVGVLKIIKEEKDNPDDVPFVTNDHFSDGTPAPPHRNFQFVTFYHHASWNYGVVKHDKKQDTEQNMYKTRYAEVAFCKHTRE